MHFNSRVTIVGLGKIGFPLAVQFASMGLRVEGVDLSESLVSLVNSGVSPFEEPSSPVSTQVLIDRGLLSATTNLSSSVSSSTFVVVVVPLYVDDFGNPDFRNIDAVVREIGRNMTEGTCVIFETTLPIGTTRSRFTPMLEKESDLTPGEDFFVAFSPERVSSGTVYRDFKLYPKLVGGINEESTRFASELYERGFEFDARSDLARQNGVWRMASSEAAEFAKLAETTFRDVNIALANTFAEHAQELGVSYREIQEACNSQPFSMLHSPGISVGGHCIPVYPQMYLQSHPSAEIVSLGRRINSDMPERALSLLSNRMGDLQGKRILVSGLSYRTGVKERAFSGGEELSMVLTELGAECFLVDELFTPSEILNFGFDVPDDSPFDALVINSGTRNFQLSLLSMLKQDAFILDGRSVLSIDDWSEVIQIGEGF